MDERMYNKEYSKGMENFNNGEYEKAISNFFNATFSKRLSINALYFLGVASKMVGSLDDSIRYLKKAEMKLKDNLNTYEDKMLYVEILLELRDNLKALRLLDELLRDSHIASEKKYVLLKIGSVLNSMGNSNIALNIYKKIISSCLKSDKDILFLSYNGLASCYLAMGDKVAFVRNLKTSSLYKKEKQ